MTNKNDAGDELIFIIAIGVSFMFDGLRQSFPALLGQ